MSKSSYIMPLDSFVRSVEVNKSKPHSIFLGAGASISSNIPSAYTCIWQWKQQIFISNNPLLERQVQDLGLKSVRDKIQKWLDSEGTYPDINDPSEYGFYVEKCYPIAADRSEFFSRLVDGIKPHFGYQWLCLLAKSDVIEHVWTTNFDRLSAKAAEISGLTPLEIGLDTASRIEYLTPKQGQLACISIHGDYRYDSLKNTETEIQKQDMKLMGALKRHLEKSTLIVAGYSGRDKSVMDALEESLSTKGIGRFYWCGYGEDSEPSVEVEKLLSVARSAGREAYYIPTHGFDDLMWRLSNTCLKDQSLLQAQKMFSTYSESQANVITPFKVPKAQGKVKVASLLKSNSFLLTCPDEIFQFSATGFDSPGAWSRLRQQTDGFKVFAGLLRGKILAFGAIDEIERAFSGKLTGIIERVPISDRELSYDDGVVVSLLTSSLLCSLAERNKLNHDNKRTLWKPSTFQPFESNGIRYKVHDALKISLRKQSGTMRIILEPTIRLLTFNGEMTDAKIEGKARTELLANQWNKKFNDTLDSWRRLLFPKKSSSFHFPTTTSPDFTFTVKSIPDFASIVEYQPSFTLNLPNNIKPHVSQRGMKFKEPDLLFSRRSGDGYMQDTHPLRGLSRNQPYDFGLTKQGLDTDVRLGVICPQKDSMKLQNFLGSLQQGSRVSNNQEYMVEFKGFSSEFGLPLQIPGIDQARWVQCPNIDPSLNVQEGAARLREHIVQSINALISSSSPSVIVVFIPSRWDKWTRYNENNEHFDLHNFIKAYCVQRGKTSQFLREKTLAQTDKCRVKWWLSLALYTKAMRTPWALDKIDSDTAYLGLGFSIDRNAMTGNHIILGCSHIYNSQGLGLNYRLSKVNDPIIRGKNPFMALDDARRMGESSRQLFFESMGKLPSRVVIHKRTRFSRDEKLGLREGLSGIPEIDMLEINIDPASKYVSSRFKNGKFEGDGFPVNRGSAVVIDEQKALCWVHGSTQALQPKFRYYQGKRRIPAPLTLIRHFGKSPLNVLVPEILGLSKMNWNNFDMYTQLPATLQSSNDIARIGSLLERFGDNSYDYRLFI